MMKIVVFQGDGIGPEIVLAATGILATVNGAMDLGIDIDEHPAGLSALETHGTTFPQASQDAASQADGIILGPLSTFSYPPEKDGGINASARLRNALDLYANLRPARSSQSISAKCPNMDLLIVRENTEGFYANGAMHAGGGEFAPVPGVTMALRRITAHCSQRIAVNAFECARLRRRRVTAVHKANVLKLTDGLFLDECRAVANQFKDIAYDEIIVDAATCALVSDEGDLDVIVTTNLFGDILSNLAAELSGGLGLAGSLNHGQDHAMAQACHGSAPDIAGQGIANPVSIIRSVAMLLRHLGEVRSRPSLTVTADHIDHVVDWSLTSPATRTVDVGGTATTDQVAGAIRDQLKNTSNQHPAQTKKEGDTAHSATG